MTVGGKYKIVTYIIFNSPGGEYMSEIKRKKGESFDAYLRRVRRRWQQSGKLLQAKKVQFLVPKPSKVTKKRSALMRKRAAEKRAYLERIGKLEEPTVRGGGRSRP